MLSSDLVKMRNLEKTTGRCWMLAFYTILILQTTIEFYLSEVSFYFSCISLVISILLLVYYLRLYCHLTHIMRRKAFFFYEDIKSSMAAGVFAICSAKFYQLLINFLDAYMSQKEDKKTG